MSSAIIVENRYLKRVENNIEIAIAKHCITPFPKHLEYPNILQVLENININTKNMYARVPACQITTYYYVGFAYMMMRRYQDAIRTFSNILLYIQRTKQMFESKTYMYDTVGVGN